MRGALGVLAGYVRTAHVCSDECYQLADALWEHWRRTNFKADDDLVFCHPSKARRSTRPATAT